MPANNILGSLPRNDWEPMKADFRSIRLAHQHVLYEVGDPLRQIYFPINGEVSVVAVFASGASVEMAAVGPEGLVETSVILGSRIALRRHIVQVPGAALVTSYDAFKRWERGSVAFRQLLLTYAQAFLTQILQSVACNAVHSIEQRAARWLLTCHDRTNGDSFFLTQEFLAEMLGVGRPTVSLAARALQAAGLIRYSRGRVTVVDRPRLEKTSCECYGVIRAAFEIHAVN